MMVAAISIEPVTGRFDVEHNAGDLFDILVPIIDKNGAPVSIDDADIYRWAAYAAVRRNALTPTALHAWSTEAQAPRAYIVSGTAAKVRLVATPIETAAWQDWPTYRCGWDVVVVEPQQLSGDIDGVPTPFRVAKGAFRVQPQYTRPPPGNSGPAPTAGYGLSGYGTSGYGE